MSTSQFGDGISLCGTNEREKRGAELPVVTSETSTS